jgi:uncharacterized protein with HEPN domain
MSNNKAERIPDYIEHIISAISQIEKYSLGFNQDSFIENDMVQDACIRRFEVIGEAARRIISTDQEFTKKYPMLELESAYRMRNALAHGYETVNLRTVWDTIEQKLPALKAEAIEILKLYDPRPHS